MILISHFHDSCNTLPWFLLHTSIFLLHKTNSYYTRYVIVCNKVLLHTITQCVKVPDVEGWSHRGDKKNFNNGRFFRAIRVLFRASFPAHWSFNGLSLQPTASLQCSSGCPHPLESGSWPLSSSAVTDENLLRFELLDRASQARLGRLVGCGST